jgi:hypothetical protein
MKRILIIGILAVLGLLPTRAISLQSPAALPYGNGSWAISDQLNGSVEYDKFGATVRLEKVSDNNAQPQTLRKMRLAFNPWLSEVVGRRCYIRSQYDSSIVALARSNPDYRVKVLTQIIQAWRATESEFHRVNAADVSCDNRVHPPSDFDDR